MARPRTTLCVLVSGGLDSSVLLYQLLQDRSRRLVPLYIQCGLRWEQVEGYWLRRFLQAVRTPHLAPLRIVRLPLHSLYGAHWSLTGRHLPGPRSADRAVYLPGRNMLLLSAAAILCVQHRISTIAIGILNSNPFGDATPQFFRRLSTCLTQALRHPLHVVTPLHRFHKVDLIRSAGEAPLALTFSCLRPRGHQHCGRCNKCAERSRAFQAAGIADPTRYAR